MKLLKYLVLVSLSLIVACGESPKPPELLTVTLTSSELNPALNSSVTFTATATPTGKIVKLELLEGTTVKKIVNNAANLEQNVLMDVAGKRSFTARVTDSAGVVTSSAVVEVVTAPAPIAVTLTPTFLETTAFSRLQFRVTAAPANKVKKLELLEGATILKAVDNAATFDFAITLGGVGKQSFKARATTTDDVAVNSAVVEINVTQPINALVLKGGIGRSGFMATGDLSEISATVTFNNPASVIQEIEFFDETGSLGKDISQPIALDFPLTFTTIGVRNFRAVAKDQFGTTVEGSVQIKVVEAFGFLRANPQEIGVGDPTTLVLEQSLGNGRITKVEFFEGTTLLGTDSREPFELVVDNFTTVGSRDFKAVVTDSSGLKSESSTSVKTLPFVLNVSNDRFNDLLSPDTAIFTAKYTGNTFGLDLATNFSILKSDGSPAPTDGSLGKLEIIPQGAINEIRKMRYVPPTIATDDVDLRIKIKATSVLDPSQSIETDLRIRKKGTVFGIQVFTDPVAPLRVNRPAIVGANLLGTEGNVTNKILFTLSDFTRLGTVACAPPEQCAIDIESDTIIARKFLFTPTKTGTLQFSGQSVMNAGTGNPSNPIQILP